MPELTQSELLSLMTPERDRLKAEVLDRKQFEVAFEQSWNAAMRLEGNDRAQAMAFARLAQLRLTRDKQTREVLDLDKDAPPRDLQGLNLVELQVLAYYTALCEGTELDLAGCDWRVQKLIDLMRSLGQDGG